MNRISVVGLGKLGACLAACAASKGMQVVGADTSTRTVAAMNDGRAPVVEPHLAEMMAANRARLRATGDTAEAVIATEATFVVVPTPSEPGGGFSLEYVLAAARDIGAALASKRDYHLVVISSTVLPGSMQTVQRALEEASGRSCGADFGLCYNPEFIALGSVLRDMLNPDFVLIGESDERAGALLAEWQAAFCESTPAVTRMNFVNAELTKIAVNSYVTTKITFANTLANICERLPGANVDVVTSALGRDSRIGARYLKGALGYGGPCFPRDNAAFARVAQTAGIEADVAVATDRANRQIAATTAARLRELSPAGARVAILGTAYKPDTAVVEESQGLALAAALSGSHKVVVFDPLALDATKAALGPSVEYAASLPEALRSADLVIVCNPCREFAALSPPDFEQRPEPVVLYDCWRILQSSVNGCPWIRYVPAGVGEPSSPCPAV
ncbi:MAG TPA: nucleotide sugar dehydrogenase [Vicinamibacterales bacterium]|jgi:UDPglucose 6-dehydrogenase|nr:nucleotide sugar dehydrogenase [Vicinamibacterales bacterium]